MKLGLRTKMIGTLLVAMLISGAISAFAARQTMATDLNKLAVQQVTSGSTGFAGYWDQKRDTVSLLVAQSAINEAIKRSLTQRNQKMLEATLSGIARQGGLSFLTVVDPHSRVIARANGGATGNKLGSPYIARALSGETVNSAAVLSHDELEPEQLLPQIEAAASGREGVSDGLALIAAMPISDDNQHTVGAVYGGLMMNHYYDVVDQAAHALGGKAAVIFGDQLISSSILRADGTRLVDENAPENLRSVTETYTGVDREGGLNYLVRVEPILNDQNQVIASQWFGVPLETFTGIQQHTLSSLLLWGLVGIVIGLAIAIPVVDRVSRQLIQRSRQVRDSAKELSVVIVGSEVSGDNIAQTRAAVERQGELLLQAAAGQDVSEKIVAAAALNAEILGDVTVIDTLATEMSERTQQAVVQVGELNDVAAGLNELVTGSK